MPARVVTLAYEPFSLHSLIKHYVEAIAKAVQPGYEATFLCILIRTFKELDGKPITQAKKPFLLRSLIVP